MEKPGASEAEEPPAARAGTAAQRDKNRIAASLFNFFKAFLYYREQKALPVFCPEFLRRKAWLSARSAAERRAGAEKACAPGRSDIVFRPYLEYPFQQRSFLGIIS
jgi:hypothetical protein